MTERYPLPSSTKTYNDRDQKLSREFFDVSRYVEMFKPTAKEFEACRRGAVSIYGYSPEVGSRSPFPAPIDFIEDLFPYKSGDKAAAWPDRSASHRANYLLRLSYKIHNTLSELPNGTTTKIVCPKCRTQSIRCGVSTLPAVIDGVLVYDIEPGISHIDIECKCRLSIEDFEHIEHEAIQKHGI